MVPDFSIGIIGGSGWLGRAIADAVLDGRLQVGGSVGRQHGIGLA